MEVKMKAKVVASAIAVIAGGTVLTREALKARARKKSERKKISEADGSGLTPTQEVLATRDFYPARQRVR
jgi:hypothetical protein